MDTSSTHDTTAADLAQADAEIAIILRQPEGCATRTVTMLTRAWLSHDVDVFTAALVARVVTQHDRLQALSHELDNARKAADIEAARGAA
jgi:hypothetical protein